MVSERPPSSTPALVAPRRYSGSHLSSNLRNSLLHHWASPLARPIRTYRREENRSQRVRHQIQRQRSYAGRRSWETTVDRGPCEEPKGFTFRPTKFTRLGQPSVWGIVMVIVLGGVGGGIAEPLGEAMCTYRRVERFEPKWTGTEPTRRMREAHS